MTAAITAAPSRVLAWGMHPWITKGAVEVLPEWQQSALGDEKEHFISQYCLIPDWVYSRKDLAPFAMRDDKPGVLYHLNLHLPPEQQEMYDIISYFLGRAVDTWQAGNPPDALKYLGTLAHALEDWGCPAHTVPEDNQFNLMRQFLPPPEAQRHVLVHGPMEGGSFRVDINGYTPVLLGNTVPEMSFHLLHRAVGSVVHARSQVIPILQALYAEDKEAVSAAQGIAADYDAGIVADLLHSFLSLVAGKTDAAELGRLERFDLSLVMPLEAPHFFIPQSMFFSKPYWGQPSRGIHLRKGNGRDLVPLSLRIEHDGETGETAFPDGIGVGTRSVLTYFIPPGVYRTFETWAGVQKVTECEGSVTFEIYADGASVERVGPLTAEAPAHRFRIPLEGVSELRLVAGQGDATAAEGNYAVWGRPRLMK